MPPAEKRYSLILTEHAEYLHALLKADTVDEEIISGYVDEIVAKSEETGKDRILLYRDIPAALSEGTAFHTVKDSLEALRGKKLALVNPYQGLDAELRFGLIVGQNRGGNYKLFSNEEEAVKWLVPRSAR